MPANRCLCRTRGDPRWDRARVVSDEVARNGGRRAYTAVGAQSRAYRARARPKLRLLVGSPGLASHVQARLAAKDSPMTISRELAAGLYPDVAVRISHESIYVAIYGHGRRGLPAGLHRRRRCREHHRASPEPQATLGPLACVQPDQHPPQRR